MSNLKIDKEGIKKNRSKYFQNLPKSNSATAPWWNSFVRIKDEMFIHFGL
jgi:hypothetical protein